jgi:transcription initiation factor IIE alpha subunit
MILDIIYENGYVTSSELGEKLNLKKRRAQVILGGMMEDKLICKRGASRNTNYVINEELFEN